VNFDGISDIGPKGRPKSEKNASKIEHFSFVLRSIFLCKTYFSLIVKTFIVIGKISNLQKLSKISVGKTFLFCFLKN
jgi:hypothetical protein